MLSHKEPILLNTKKFTAVSKLCQCLSGALGQSLSPSDLPKSEDQWASVLRRSGDHLVTPILRWALQEQEGMYDTLPPSVIDYLEAVYALNLEKNLCCQEQLSEMTSALNDLGVTPVLLKGAAMLVSGLYPTAGERMITDLDILIPEKRLSEVLAKMQASGYQSIEGKIDLAEVALKALSHKHHYPALVHRDWPVSIELHVQPVVMRYQRLLCCEDVLSSANKTVLPGGECLLPDPTIMIMHSVIHAFLFDTMDCMRMLSLRQLFEFILLAQKYSAAVDWDMIKERFENMGYESSLQQYLHVATNCFEFDTAVAPPWGLNNTIKTRPYLDLMRLRQENPSAIWATTLVYELIARSKRLIREPKKIRRLVDPDFYAKLGDVIWRK